MAKGMTPRQAVREAYKEFPVMKTMQKEIQGQLGEELIRGFGGAVAPSIKTAALRLSWAPDGLTLSKRTTKGGAVVRENVVETIREQLRKNVRYDKIAKAIFDGYKHGGVIPTQDIPKFIQDLQQKSVTPGYNRMAFMREFKDVKKYVARLNTSGMRAAYTALTDAIEKRNEHLVNNAIYQATQERTRYFAERIARTEMARAYHDGFMAKYGNDDDVVAFKWKRSDRHLRYDICDLYAEADLYGLGKGIYPKDKAPQLPVHPNCMCYLKPITRGMLGNETPIPRVEQGGREYIEGLPKAKQEKLLGVYGRNAVLDNGISWTRKARNFDERYMVSRLTKAIAMPEAFKDMEALRIPESKISSYMLNKNHAKGGPKAIAIEKYLGYTQDKAEEFEAFLRGNLPNGELIKGKQTKFGQAYRIDFYVDTLQGEKVLFRTGWIDDLDGKPARLVSGYLKPEKKRSGGNED